MKNKKIRIIKKIRKIGTKLIRKKIKKEKKRLII